MKQSRRISPRVPYDEAVALTRFDGGGRLYARALARMGACPVHRRSFAAVREALGLPPLPPWPSPPSAHGP